ncbi:MAG: nitroreductase family protein [Porphyromonas sp.]|nr:nitroreductase family protein [Porphyromonas sp.]
MEDLKNLFRRNRSYRRFDESKKIDSTEIEKWIEAARYCASGRNLQPIKYIIVTDVEACNALTATVKWAGYLPEWDGPEEGERPTAYIAQLLDTSLTSTVRLDDGLQLSAITLSVVNDGYGCCIFQSYNAATISEILALPDEMKLISIVAVGKPVEEVVIKDIDPGECIKYYRDEKRRHVVPKRKLSELIYRVQDKKI